MTKSQSLDELSASKAFIRDILDATPGQVFAFDAESLQILLVNRNASRELGIDLKRLEVSTPLDFLPELQKRELIKLLRPLILGRKSTVRLHTTQSRGNQAIYPVEITFRRTQIGDRKCVLAVMEQRTPEREALRRLHESEEKCRALVEAAHEAVVSADANGMILSWNQHAEHVFGFSAQEMIGQPLEHMMPARFRSSHASGMKRYLDSGVARLLDKVVRLRGRHRSGREIPLEASLSAWEQDGKIGFTGHLRDLSRQRIVNRDDQHARRALVSLSRCNAALLQACSEQLLLDSLCRLMVAEGGYPYVWIGFQEFGKGHPIRIAADASRNGKRLTNGAVSWKEGPCGGGPTAQALRSARTVICHHPAIEEEPMEGPESPHALGFLSCCAIPFRIAGKLVGAITVYADDNDSFGAQERVLLEDLACSCGHGIHAARTRLELKAELAAHENRERKLRRSLSGTTKAIFRALEARDPETANHQQRVARIAIAIARELHLNEEQIDSISISSCLHDIGKLAIPPDLLTATKELSSAQTAEIQAHTTIGFGLLQGIDFPWQVAEVALQHHERIDGKGYPRGLRGDEILLEARIVAVADFVDAVSSPRRYRPATHIDDTLQRLAQESGTRFDATIVTACQSLFDDPRKSAHLRAAYL
jgi:PAS domain S-box-containing protein/putative nucleotidyltransferase with HDIG domain